MGAKISYNEDQYDHEYDEEGEEGDTEQQTTEENGEWEAENWSPEPMKIFISYKWLKNAAGENVTQMKCKRIKECLKENGFSDVWLDVDQMKGSIQKKMAKNVFTSAVVLICFSKGYEESVNCMFELSCAFAYKLALKEPKRKIIPVKLDDSMPHIKGSLLSQLVGSQKFYNFSTDELLEENLSELIETLESIDLKKKQGK